MIQLLQFKGKSFISKGIRFFNWGPYSHSALLNTETGEIIEAWHIGGVRKVTLKDHGHTPGTEVDVYTLPKEVDHKGLWEDALREVGKGYDFAGIFGFMARKTSQSDKKWFCSEMAFQLVARNGSLLLKAPAYKVSPSLLAYSPLLKFKEAVTL